MVNSRALAVKSLLSLMEEAKQVEEVAALVADISQKPAAGHETEAGRKVANELLSSWLALE